MAFSAERTTYLANKFGFDSSESFRMWKIDGNVPDNYNDAITSSHPPAEIYSSHSNDEYTIIIMDDTGDYTVDSANFNIVEVTE